MTSDFAPARARAGAGVVIGAYAILALLVVVLTPPWEANDEPDHVRNVQSLVEGLPYRIGDASGIESHQAPLYYGILAAWQQLLGIEPRLPRPVGLGVEGAGLFLHDIPTDGADQRIVSALRLPGVVFGVLTLLLTAAIARLVSRDPWTPVVAAAVVASVPKYVFVSGVVNNDNLAALGGAAVTYVSLRLLLRPPSAGHDRLMAFGLLGACVGGTMLAKVSAATIVLPALVAAVAISRGVGPTVAAVLALGVGALLVTGPWLAFNVLNYGDPLALHAQVAHLRQVQPGVFHEGNYLARLVDGPRFIWKSFWYMSGWNQFQWPTWAYAPFWGMTSLALGSWLRRTGEPLSARPSAYVLLGSAALAGITSVMVVAVTTAQAQGRHGFFGLPAIAVVVALGLERWNVPLPLRFALPALGFVGSVIAIRQDIVLIYL